MFRWLFAVTALVGLCQLLVPVWYSTPQLPSRAAGVTAPAPVGGRTSVDESRLAVQFGAERLIHLENIGYDVGYSPLRHLPLWVHYRLNAGHPIFQRFPRPKDFVPDTRVPDPICSFEYSRSGFERGHLAASSTIAVYFGREAQLETFLLTNVVPQVHWHNEGIWNTLERIEAWDYPRRYGQIETACGPVLGVGFIRNKIPIPRALYKILKRPDGQCLAFIIAQDGREIMAEELPAQLTSVRDIERKTGLRFEFIDERRKDSAASRVW